MENKLVSELSVIEFIELLKKINMENRIFIPKIKKTPKSFDPILVEFIKNNLIPHEIGNMTKNVYKYINDGTGIEFSKHTIGRALSAAGYKTKLLRINGKIFNMYLLYFKTEGYLAHPSESHFGKPV